LRIEDLHRQQEDVVKKNLRQTAEKGRSVVWKKMQGKMITMTEKSRNQAT